MSYPLYLHDISIKHIHQTFMVEMVLEWDDSPQRWIVSVIFPDMSEWFPQCISEWRDFLTVFSMDSHDNRQKSMIPGLVNIQKAIENGPVEIVDIPSKNGDFSWLFVCLPKGIPMNFPLGFLHFFRLPCALGEFRSTGGLAVRIVGFAEHITSTSAAISSGWSWKGWVLAMEPWYKMVDVL